MDLSTNQLSDRYNEAKQPAARSDEPPKPKPGKPAGEQRKIKLNNGTIELPRDHKDRPVKFAGNSIRTSKYTVYNFLFLNLFTQLIRPANFYFVCIAILQGIPQVSSSQGKPTILLPLCFVLLVSAVKDGYEDYKRHVEDNGENNRQYAIYSPSENNFQRVASKELEVGHFVQVNDDETFPADLLLVYSSAKGGYCYVETSNLDGETNLKIKMVPEPLRAIKKAEELSRLSLQLNADAPNGVLDQFSGSVVIGNDKENFTPLGVDNILLRGSKLRNTGIIYGLVMYTGEETKIRQNSTEKSRSTVKRSSVERTMNKQILGMFCLQVAICFIAAVIAGVWHGVHRDEAVYLALTDSAGLTGLIRFFTWFIIFAGFVPISLLVSLELVKFWQGLFMGWDVEMCHTIEADIPADRYQFARAQTSGLNEELGQVQFILSDKTGTLTCNSMDFRKCLIGTQQYGTGETDISRAARYRSSFMKTGSSTSMNATAPTNRAEKGWGRTLSEINLVNVEETYRKNHVNFNAKQRLEAALSANYLAQKAHRESGRELPDTPGHGSLEEEFLLCLSLCNTVFPAVDDKPRQAPAANPSANAERIAYKSSSPDEEALVEFARFMGYELFQRNPPIISIRITRPAATHTTGSETVPFEQLALCDFTSKRKRMTVVVRAPDGKIRIITKGADNVVSAVLHGADAASASGSFDATLAQYQPNWPETVRQLARFGEQGLRTLVIASAERDASWWDDPVNGMSVKYSAAMRACAVEGPDEIGHFKGACSGQCRRCAIEEQVERAAELKLIGATAIEDKLQDNVADAIKAFTDGGIRVWVLTGDKMETAINIGMACNLLEPSMERRGNLLRIDSETQEGVEQQLDKLIETLSDRTAEQNKDALGLVVTSAAIGRVFRNGEALFPKFWWIASQCKGVICCRMQPNQKARVVALVKASTPAGVTTLAVGDGANDEQMIREADVGVGIRGVEGTSAVRASDYAISQFFFLKRLLFVHGRLSYRRIATLICYIFYKNSLICFTQFWFGIYSGFSGQPIFMEWAYQLYNVMFTAIPILVFAVLDRDISVDLLEKYPKIYRLTSNGQLFNYRIFWRWMVSSLLQSLIIFFFVFAAYDLYSVDGDGQIHDFWTMGLVVYTVTVLVTNIQMALIMTSWTWIHHLAIWGSIFSFYLAMIIFSGSTFWATAGADYYYLQYRLFGTARYWFTVILAVCAALAIDFTIHAWFTLNPPPSKLSAGPPPIAAPKPAITARSPLVTSHVIADSGKSASPASSPSLSSQGAGPEITGKDQQPLWGRPSNVAQSHPSPHHGAPAPSMPTVSEDGPGPDTSLALIFDRGQIPPNTVDLEEKKEDPEAAARSAKEAAEWDPMRHQDTRLSGFSFSHTSGQGQRLGFKF